MAPTVAKVVRVKTNSFVITQLPTTEYHQYHVQFIPDITIASKRQRVMQRLQTDHGNIFNPPGVYDGRNVFYTPRVLSLATGGSGSFMVNLGNGPAYEGDPGVFRVIFSRTSGLVIHPSDVQNAIKAHEADQLPATNVTTAINLLNLLFRQDSNQNHPNNGRAFFPPSQDKKGLADTGLELCRGFYQSVRPTTGNLLITVDTAVAAVYRNQDLIKVANALLNLNKANHVDAKTSLDLADPRDLRTIQNFLKNRRVTSTTSGDRTKTIYEIIPGPIGQRRFRNKEGEKITIAEHLYRAYTIRLKHADSFGVRISGLNADFEVILPAELLTLLPGQFYKKRLPPNAVDEVVRFATRTPAQKLEAITGSDSPIHGYQHSQHIHVAGMKISVEPVVLPARLLSPPVIQFRAPESPHSQDEPWKVEPRNGSWNVLHKKFRRAAEMTAWGVLNLNINMRRDVSNIVHTLRSCGKKLGMKIEEPTACIEGNDQSPEKDLDRLVDLICQQGKSKIDMIVVLLRTHAEETRIRVKHWGDIKNGIHTSCLRESQLRRALRQLQNKDDQYFNNCLIKFNAKLGGQYALPQFHELGTLPKPFMIMGADVSHPGPGSGENRPSITSLVWCWDTEASKYVAYTTFQPPRKEIIQDLRTLAAGAIWNFLKQAPAGPRSIVMYRDGVSEGELSAVKTAEVKAIRDACKDVWQRRGWDLRKVPLPGLTFIVVVKRHHVVFFPGERDAADSKGNCRPGLAVEGLHSPWTRGFHLQSHAPIQGTARSGQYTILADDNFNMDCARLQRLSFELCHTYAKATRSISIPAPVYYADLVCSRAKFHLDPDSDIDLDGASNSDTFNTAYWNQQFKPVSSNDHFDKTMYFL